MRVLIDTNAYAQLAKGNTHVLTLLQSAEEIVVSSIVLGELVRELRENGTPIPTNDIWIAATAFETASRVLSFDTHFGLVPGLLMVL